MAMLILLKKLRQDENGVILSAEIVIIGSLLVIGLITGLSCLEQSVNGELRDVADAIGSLDQSYSFSGHRKPGFSGQCCAYTAGSSFTNCERRSGDCVQDVVGCQEIVIAEPDGCCHQVVTERPCGHCGSCGAEVEVGCSACGHCVMRVASEGPRCLNTDVPNMKATELPLPERTFLGADSEAVIHSESIAPIADPEGSGELPDSGTNAKIHGEVSEPQPGVSFECCPILPGTSGEALGKNDLNIPDFVW